MRLYADIHVTLDGVQYATATIEVNAPARNHVRLDPLELGRALRGIPPEHTQATRFGLDVEFRLVP